jgi:hypothetical protein
MGRLSPGVMHNQGMPWAASQMLPDSTSPGMTYQPPCSVNASSRTHAKSRIHDRLLTCVQMRPLLLRVRQAWVE